MTTRVEVNIHFYAELGEGSTIDDLDVNTRTMLDVLKDEHNWKIIPQHPRDNFVDTEIRVLR